ncbi:glutathione S-transferase family protein [Novosphingopyxis baekryungensis]|uniref:glutathione S-transferase family protein n=1 Tax=Novosphingopyxis baekryungensis TaxID=279369 RepID=UPI0003B692F3|nr:glutathione S-transferase family protein [Novosphingopyxis baekryungensis]
MKLIIGNKAYSSWSMRGWLAAKQSGLPFEEILVPLYTDEWDNRKREEDMAPSHGKVPILWDGESVIWDSIAIVDWLADKTSRDRFWPKDEVARGMARSMCAEMHCGFMDLRRECPMNTRRSFPDHEISDAARADAIRILQLWAEARARFGKSGPYLFGTFSAADIMYAPVVSRFKTYGFKLPGFAISYSEAILEHQWVQDWCAAAEEEDWTLERYEDLGSSATA